MTLTKRQRELMRELVKGKSNKEIAKQLNVTEGTVRQMLHAIYANNDAPNRISMALRYQEHVNGR